MGVVSGVIKMSVEQDIGELKSDVKWIKEAIREIKREKQINKGYLLGLAGSVIIAISSLIIGLVK